MMGWGGITALRDAGGQNEGFSHMQTSFESVIRDAALCFFHPSEQFSSRSSALCPTAFGLPTCSHVHDANPVQNLLCAQTPAMLARMTPVHAE